MVGGIFSGQKHRPMPARAETHTLELLDWMNQLMPLMSIANMRRAAFGLGWRSGIAPFSRARGISPCR